jgi:hypothetical protein
LYQHTHQNSRKLRPTRNAESDSWRVKSTPVGCARWWPRGIDVSVYVARRVARITRHACFCDAPKGVSGKRAHVLPLPTRGAMSRTAAKAEVMLDDSAVLRAFERENYTDIDTIDHEDLRPRLVGLTLGALARHIFPDRRALLMRRHAASLDRGRIARVCLRRAEAGAHWREDLVHLGFIAPAQSSLTIDDQNTIDATAQVVTLAEGRRLT